jgi:alpha-N-arabinofuranosidase
MTEKGGKAWKQTIFYPFKDASLYGRGTVLRCPITVEKYDSQEYNDIPYLEAVAVHNQEKNEISIFAVNRNLEQTMQLEAEIAGFGDLDFIEHRVLCNKDLNAYNSAIEEKVHPINQSVGRLESTMGSNRLEAALPPASWNMIRLKV